MSVATAQDPKKTAQKRGPRLWVSCSQAERKAAHVVAKHHGYARGELLRRHSLNDILALYQQLTSAK